MGFADSLDSAVTPGAAASPARPVAHRWRSRFAERERVSRDLVWTLVFAHLLVAHLVQITTAALAPFTTAAVVTLVALDVVLVRRRGARAWPRAVPVARAAWALVCGFAVATIYVRRISAEPVWNALSRTMTAADGTLHPVRDAFVAAGYGLAVWLVPVIFDVRGRRGRVWLALAAVAAAYLLHVALTGEWVGAPHDT